MVTVLKDNTQVAASTSRRRFTAEHKLKILKEAEECKKTGMIGAMLRREGFYSSRLTEWTNARERGEWQKRCCTGDRTQDTGLGGAFWKPLASEGEARSAE
jgi:hypothetical protein